MFRSIRSKVMFATAINLLILFLVLMLVAVHSVRHVDQQRDEAVRRKTEEQAEERERLGKAVAGSVAYQVAGLVANWDQAARTTAGQIVQKVKERYKSIVTEVIIAPKGTATFPTEAAVRLQKDVKDMLFAQSGETDTIRFDAASLKYTAAIAPIRDDLDKVTGSVAAIVWRPTYEPAAEGLAAAHFAYIYLLIGFAAVLIFSIIFTEIFLSQGILKPVRALTVAVERAATRGEISGEVVVGSKDEIGQLAVMFELMQQNLREITEHASAMAQGDLRRELRAEGELAEAFRKMQDNLLTIANQAKVISQGNVSENLTVRGELADAFREMEEYLRVMRNHAQALTQGDIYHQLTASGELADAFREMTENMRRIAEEATAIAAGDLTRTVDAKGNLPDAFNQMVGSLASLVKQIRDTVVPFGASLDEIVESAEQQATYATEQTTSLLATSSTSEEIAATSRQITNNASAVAAIAAQTLDAAQRGREGMDEAIHAMEAIRTGTEEGANRILAVEQRVQGIGDVIELINDVADQTNLLALNAGIEAARAGEAGKGFGVVALEIRRLAESVMVRTKEINDIIDEIRNSTSAAVMSSQDERRKVDNGEQVARKAADYLEQIVEMADKTAEAAKQISVSTQQQQSASEQLSATLKEITEVTQQSTIGSKNTMASSEKLRQLSGELQTAVGQFKV